MHLLTAYQNNIFSRIKFFSLSALIGVLVGFATLGLIELIGLVQIFFFADASEQRYVSIVEASPSWLVLITPAAGGLFVGLLMHFIREKRYHGIPDVMEACAVRGARMDAKSGIVAALAASVSMGSGVPVGREGPAVHIGASISAWIAEKLNLTQSDSLILLGCGAASAVTASFNAPIAGVLFALEVVVGYYTLRVFAPIVVASVGAVIVRHMMVGSQTLFSLEAVGQASLWEFPLFAILGLISALFVLLMLSVVGTIQDFWAGSRIPLWARPAMGGLLIGVIAVEFPHILGSGYISIQEVLEGPFVPVTLLALLLMRLLGTSIAIGSGFAGGVFSPSLVFGALLGALMWYGSSLVVPLELSSQAVYVIIGMGGVVSAMLGAPISTVLIVFELTGSYGSTIGVMLAAAMASTVMQLSPHTSFFRWQLKRRGINLDEGRNQSLLRTQTIESLVQNSFSKIQSSSSIAQAQKQLNLDQSKLIVLLDKKDQIIGSADLNYLVASSIDVGADLLVSEVLRGPEVSVRMQTNLISALQTMADYHTNILPVVHQEDDQNEVFVGIITKSDLLQSYYDVVRSARAEEHGVN